MLDTLKVYWDKFEAWMTSEISPDTPWFLVVAWHASRIIYALVRDIVNGQLTLHAMSLVYTTMLSIVPLLALSFSVLRAFDVQDRFTPMLYGFFEPMGEKGIEIYNSVLGFIENMKVGVLGFVGFVLLFYTAISLIQKIERAFNSIWFAPDLRSFSQRFSNYLTMVLVGPVMMVSALSLTAGTMNSSIIQSLITIEPFGMAIVAIGKLTPFFMIIGVFTFFYVLMPNTRVSIKSALVGGIVAGTAWQTTSIAFTTFVVTSTQYDAIYSGFAVGILLLIWLYANWLIMLVGSSIAFYHQHPNHITRERDIDASPELAESLALQVMVEIAKRFEEGAEPVSQRSLEQHNHVPAVLTRSVIDRLIKHQLILVVGDKADELSLAKPADVITLDQVFAAIRQDDLDLIRHIKFQKRVSETLDDMHTEANESLRKITLRSLVCD